ncbi:cytochrome ubiquinol oxidase subunit I [bacterium]|nr:cytochrome ubiquinol oxidase subunit I [bacterium]
MDPVLLARIQFAVTIGFHYIFPPITLGLTVLIVIFLGFYLKTNDELYDRIARFWISILAIIFGLGVATGIVMEFQFGTNWEQYSRFVGDIFGAPLAAEGVFAFFLESTFLGVLLFGRNKVSRKMYFFSAVMVMVGSTLSAFWIIVANSWQQTPAGYHIVNGRAELTNFFDAVFNPSTLYRYFHAVVGGWITGAFFVAGLSGYYLLKKQHLEFAKRSIIIALVFAVISSMIQIELGHLHAVQVTHTQPEKMATFEAIFETQKNAPMAIIGIPNVEEQRIDYEISIPGLLSFMVAFDTDFEVKGLNEFEKDLLPPIMIPFFSYRIMVGLGFYFVLLALVGIVLHKKDKIAEAKSYLLLLLISIPLPIIANEMGWIAAEVGRQPWIVYHELKTADAISTVVSAGEILFSLILFSCLYAVIFSLFVFLVQKKLKKGPEVVADSY